MATDSIRVLVCYGPSGLKGPPTMARNCNHAVRVRAVSYAVPFIAPCASLGACAGSHARVYVFGCECVCACVRARE